MSDDRDTVVGTGGDDADNDELVSALRALAALHDPVPPDAIAAARSAVAWLTMDAELAELTVDSSVEPQLPGVRGATGTTLLIFDASDRTVEVEIIEEVGAGRRLVGQLVPPEPGTVEVRHRGGRSVAQADDVGRFTIGEVAAGPVSLRWAVGGRVFETDWVLA